MTCLSIGKESITAENMVGTQLQWNVLMIQINHLEHVGCVKMIVSGYVSNVIDSSAMQELLQQRMIEGRMIEKQVSFKLKVLRQKQARISNSGKYMKHAMRKNTCALNVVTWSQ